MHLMHCPHGANHHVKYLMPVKFIYRISSLPFIYRLLSLRLKPLGLFGSHSALRPNGGTRSQWRHFLVWGENNSWREIGPKELQVEKKRDEIPKKRYCYNVELVEIDKRAFLFYIKMLFMSAKVILKTDSKFINFIPFSPFKILLIWGWGLEKLG